jgi:hypothetical protein
MARCSASKPDGTPCERIIGASQTHCYSHDPARSDERRRAASKAAKAKGGELAEIKSRLQEVAGGVLDGTVPTARGSVVAQLYGVLLRTIECERRIKETTEFDQRLSQLEEAAAGRRYAR